MKWSKYKTTSIGDTTTDIQIEKKREVFLLDDILLILQWIQYFKECIVSRYAQSTYSLKTN